MGLVFFTQHNYQDILPSSCIHRWFLFIVYCYYMVRVYKMLLKHSLVEEHLSGLHLRYYKQISVIHVQGLCVCVCVSEYRLYFSRTNDQKSNCCSYLVAYVVFKRNYQTVFCSGSPILHTHQKYMSDPSSLFHEHLVLSLFFLHSQFWWICGGI